jgi:tetratricopeptide (TPR) repeat protein
MTNVRNIATLAKRVKDHPSDSFSKFALALELIKIDKRTQAIVLFEDIAQNDPKYVGVYYHLGEQYLIDGQNKKALNTYKKGIQIAESINDNHAKSELSTALLTLELEME